MSVEAEIQKPEYVAFYGSLMRGRAPIQGDQRYLGAQRKIPVASKIRYVGDCAISGFLYDLGDYPGLVETHLTQDKPLVQAELYEIIDADALDLLDEYEGFFPETPELSYYLRKSVPIKSASHNYSIQSAWCYFYNESIEGKPLIEPGCWRTYVTHRSR